MPIPKEANKVLQYFGPYENKKYILDKQDIKGDYKDLIGKSLNTGSRVRNSLSGRTPQEELLASELLSSLREVRFNEQEFSTCKPVSDI